jgi:hypothetical protein
MIDAHPARVDAVAAAADRSKSALEVGCIGKGNPAGSFL